MLEADYYQEKIGMLEYQGNPPQELTEAIQLYNGLLEDGMVTIKRIPAKAKRKIFNLLQMNGLQAAMLVGHSLNRRTWLIKEDQKWTEYILHTDFSEMFRNILSNAYLPEEQAQGMPVTQIWKRSVSLSMSYLYGFHNMAICEKECLFGELKNILQNNPHLQFS